MKGIFQSTVNRDEIYGTMILRTKDLKQFGAFIFEGKRDKGQIQLFRVDELGNCYDKYDDILPVEFSKDERRMMCYKTPKDQGTYSVSPIFDKPEIYTWEFIFKHTFKNTKKKHVNAIEQK